MLFRSLTRVSWLTLVRKFVDRYDDDGKNDMPGLQRPIRYWQIENEVLWQWQGTPQQYLDMLAQTSRTIWQVPLSLDTFLD